jgi:RNA polymerase sigma-70 factor (ECF subfamily)
MHHIATLAEPDGSPMEDETTLIRAAQRDRAAFGALYELHVDRVFAYLRSRTQSDDDAADLTQQVFLQALDAMSRYEDRGLPFVAWLMRIARNAAASFHGRRRQTTAWDLLPPALGPATEGDLAAYVARGDTLQRLFAGLDPQTRELLILRFGAQLTIAEIAAVVSASEAAIRMRLIRTLRKLRENYHDDLR